MLYEKPRANDDFKVIKFILSEECKHLGDLINYLYDNSLPIRPKWIYFYYGKNSEYYGLKEMEYRIFDPNDELYFWEEFLKNENSELKQIKTLMKRKNKKLNDEELFKYFVERGYNNIEIRINSIIEADNETADNQYKEFLGSLDTD